VRSVYLLCAVVVLGLIAHIILAASLPLDHPLPFFNDYTVAHVFLLWWLYVAPPFAFAAIALLIWKTWMETLPRNEKIGGWIAVIVAAAINLTMAFEILSGRL
jgi:hypothetical protein